MTAEDMQRGSGQVITDQTAADKQERRLQKGDREPRSFRGRTHAQKERIQEATERTMRGRQPAAAAAKEKASRPVVLNLWVSTPLREVR